MNDIQTAENAPANSSAPLSTEQLATRWGMQPETLEVWRQRSQGPKWFKLGEGKKSRVRYRMEDILSYEAGRTN